MNPAKVFNQSFSCLFPLVLPTVLDFTNGQSYIADFTETVDRGQIDFISSVYVNLANEAFDLTLTSNICSQQVICKAGTISYMPLFLGNAPKLQCDISAAINDKFEIIVSNIPFFPFIQTV